MRVPVVALAVISALAATPAAAQSFPTRTVRIVAPFAPGGGVDLLSRLLAAQLEKRFGQTVIVENVVGATGQIGVDNIAKAAPDGHAVVNAASGAIAINVHLIKLPYDPLKDLTLITRTVLAPTALAVNPSVPAKTLQEFIAYAKANPGKINYGTSGIGSQLHIAGEMLKQRTGIDMVSVPYRGTNPTTLALVSGEVQAAVSDLSTLLPQAEGGKVRILALMDNKRASFAPDIPTVAESGVPGFVAGAWLGLLAPSGTPPDIVRRWHKEVAEILNAPEWRPAIHRMGLEPAPNDSPEDAAAYLRQQIDMWGAAIKSADIKLGAPPN
jgi:tripartite-type tricarboxylate transporter receptor subunit TctC